MTGTHDRYVLMETRVADGGDDPRRELARLARAARLLVAGEREGGIVALTGLPGPAPRLVAPEGRGARGRSRSRTQGGPPAGRSGQSGASGLSGRAAAVAAAGAMSARPTAPGPRPRTAAERPGASQQTPSPATAPRTAPSPEPDTHFTPRVRALDLPSACLAAFGDLPARVDACRKCALGSSRTNAVFGEGAVPAELVFCGEAPGFDEDRSGRPFVGAAGELLTAMIERGLRMRREDVYILNTLKCRPPRNRAPLPIEVSACRPFLEEQLAVIRPKVIVPMGNHAVRAVLGESPGITRIRGQVIDALGVKVIPTFHPSYLLRNPAAKRDTWLDLQTVMKVLGRPLR